MRKALDFLLRNKIAVIIISLVLAITCYFLNNMVKINYNLSDYLSADTGTKAALDIMEKEFGLTGNMQVMVPNISTKEAKELVTDFDEVEGILNVGFDAEDKSYYKDGDALFVILIDGDDYSETASQVISDVKKVVTEAGYNDAEYGGSAVEKANLQNDITSQIIYILLICIALAYVILTITTRSWLEPILFLITAGLAIVFNRGTNLAFGEISYITNSISAILQLALAMDYSIMLLHAFHRKRKTIDNPRSAMVEAMIECLRPVSASALTTIAGLLALLFMSFTIGFDIGIVLMKGILFSFLVAFTLFPCVILLFNKVLDKTYLTKFFKDKTGMEEKSKIAAFSKKFNPIIVPVFFALVIGAFFVQGGNSYIFSNNATVNQAIEEKFGSTNTVVLVYNNEKTKEDQNNFIADLKKIKNGKGESVLKSYQAYDNTVLEEYDLNKFSSKMDVSKADAKMIMAMYQLYKDPSVYKMTMKDFLFKAVKIANTDEDAKDMLKKEDKDTLKLLKKVYKTMANQNTSKELYEKISDEEMTADVGVDQFSIDRIYDMYAFKNMSNTKVDFRTMLNYAVKKAKTDSKVKEVVDDKSLKDLKELQNGIKEFTSKAEKKLTAKQFQKEMATEYDTDIPIEIVETIYSDYGASKVKLIKMLNYMNKCGYITDEKQQKEIKNNYNAYKAIHKSYSYDEFLPAVKKIVKNLTGSKPSISTDSDAIEQLYVYYFDEKGKIPQITMTGKQFVDYTLSLATTNSIVKDMIGTKEVSQLEDLSKIYNTFNDANKYTYKEIQKKFKKLQKNVKSYKGNSAMTADQASGVIIKTMTKSDNYVYEPIAAVDLLQFIEKQMDSNDLLKDRISDEQREGIIKARKQVDKATDLLESETYSRVLLNIDLPNESEESYAFAKEAKELLKEHFGNDGYLAGEILSVDDLRNSFQYDQRIISIVTIISTLLIVMITFKSLSIPVILVAVIQGAIWVAMIVLNIINYDIFFMAYVVASCILMGATIDYGILLSSNYVDNRRSMGKIEALTKALKTAIPTIASSGTVLMCCGAVIKIISTETSIAATGLILGIGTFCSVIMVLLVLPSILYLCDKFILKTSLK